MKKYQYLASWDDQTLTRVGEPVVVLGDSNVSQVEVILPSNFLLDPTKAECRMYFLLPGEKESAHDVLETAVKDENGDSHVTWTIKHVHSQKGGRLAFSLTLIGDDAQWDSRTAIIPVYESRYQPESEEAEKPYTGRLDALEGSMASIRGEFAEVQDDFEELKETATLGTPIPESLVANMTEGHVYIYTGTEPGYTAGHVYYYVGGALTDGGVYGGTAVDATLTQSGQAADAKKTGDEISAIKEDLSYNSEVLNTEDGFFTYPVSNVRLTSDGGVVSDANFRTTDFIPVKLGTYKIIKKNFSNNFTVFRCTYNSQKKLIEYVTYTQNTTERELPIENANISFVRYTVSKGIYESGISFRRVGNLKDDVNIIRRNVYGNLCGDNPGEFYPVVLSEGDYITLSTSTGDVPPSPIELIFFDANYYRIGAYTLNAKRRSIKIDQTYAATKYIKWGKKPDVPMQVELGGSYTEYKEYRPNIFTCAQLLDESKNVYTYAPLPIVAVMTYNVGEWYNGTRTEMPESEYALYENIQRTILRKNYASIFCAQEYYHTMYTKALDAKNMFLYPLYKHVSTLDDTALTRGKAIATNLWVESVESVDFVNQSGVAQKYQKSYVYINGHKVCICNVHLSQIDAQAALLEAREVATAMADEEYFIVMGDFNVSFARATGAEIISTFEAIGAKPCNYGSFGQFDTYRGSTTLGTTDSPIDNIFVSSSITIKYVYMDTTKIDANLPIQDHVPLVAYLEIF